MANNNQQIFEAIINKINPPANFGGASVGVDLSAAEIEYYINYNEEFEYTFDFESRTGFDLDYHDEIQDHLNNRLVKWANGTESPDQATKDAFINYWEAWSDKKISGDSDLTETDIDDINEVIEQNQFGTSSVFLIEKSQFINEVQSKVTSKILKWDSTSGLYTESKIIGQAKSPATEAFKFFANVVSGILSEVTDAGDYAYADTIIAAYKAANTEAYQRDFVQIYDVKVPPAVAGWNFKDKADAESPINIKSYFNQYYDNLYTNQIDALERAGDVSAGSAGDILESNAEACAEELTEKIAVFLVNEYRVSLMKKLIERGVDAAEQPLSPDDYADAAQGMNDAASDMGEPTDADAQLTEEDIKKRQKFFKQCALLLRMKDLSSQYREYIRDQCAAMLKDPNLGPDEAVHYKGIPFGGRFWMVGGGQDENDSSGIVSRLFATKEMDSFLNMTPDIIGLLVPKIRLYKVFKAGYGGMDLDQVEFEFEQKTDPRGFFDGTSVDRGSGAGIKSFSFEFVGGTPATAKADIKAKLSLYFQSFQDFFTCRQSSTTSNQDGTPKYYKYVDMILYPGAHDCVENKTEEESQNNNRQGQGTISKYQYDSTYYRTRADVGWVIPDTPEVKAELDKRGAGFADQLIKALELTNKSFFLNMVDHTIDIKKDGTVTIDIDFQAYIETSLKGTRFDALVDRDILQNRATREQQLREAASKDCTPKQMVELQKSLEQAIEEEMKTSHLSLLKRIIERKKLFFVDLTDESANEFRSVGFFTSEPQFAPVSGQTNTSETSAEAAAPQGSQAASAGSTNGSYTIVSNVFKDRDIVKNVRINYFFLGDLIHVILDSCFDQATNKPLIEKTKFILSNIEVLDFNGNIFTLNLAEIPISKEFFDQWYIDKVIKTERKSYSVVAFIRELFNELIVSTMTDVCVNKDLVKKLIFDTAVFSGIGKNGQDRMSTMTFPSSGDVIIDTKSEYDAGNLPLITDQGIQTINIDKFYNYYLLYARSPSYKAIGGGNELEDLDRGVYHMHIGSRAGLVKNIKFGKTDMQFIREARFMNQGIDGLLQLGAVYKATVEMIGNTIFYPGMLIYIDPMGIGGTNWDPTNEQSIANKLGLGGYHMITRVSNSISSGKFSTTVEAQWYHSGDGNNYKMENKKIIKDDSNIEEAAPSNPGCSDYIASVQHQISKNLSAQVIYQTGQAESLEEATEQVEYAAADAVNAAYNAEVYDPIESERQAQEEALRQQRIRDASKSAGYGSVAPGEGEAGTGQYR